MPGTLKEGAPPPDELKGMSIAQLAAVVRASWKNVYFGAKPYLEAMQHLHSDDAKFGLDDAKGVCTYFLSNATGWRGETAKAVKAELKRRFKLK